jgi:hypothetical protein
LFAYRDESCAVSLCVFVRRFRTMQWNKHRTYPGEVCCFSEDAEKTVVRNANYLTIMAVGLRH